MLFTAVSSACWFRFSFAFNNCGMHELSHALNAKSSSKRLRRIGDLLATHAPSRLCGFGGAGVMPAKNVSSSFSRCKRQTGSAIWEASGIQFEVSAAETRAYGRDNLDLHSTAAARNIKQRCTLISTLCICATC
jgi:hypothetical protein